MEHMIEIAADDGHILSAYQAGNADAARGLVVVQEIFGVNAHMRQVSDRLAAAGFHVLCPALFDRAERDVELDYTQPGMQRGLALRAAIPEAGTLADIEACTTQLAAHPGGATRPVGIIGYCWGGTIAWWGATRSRRFAAAVGWYGGGIAATRQEMPHCPVQLHFGETDKSIPVSDIDAIRAAQPGIELFTYAGAGHGFGCEDRASYDEGSSRLAEQRSLAFLAEHLGIA